MFKKYDTIECIDTDGTRKVYQIENITYRIDYKTGKENKNEFNMMWLVPGDAILDIDTMTYDCHEGYFIRSDYRGKINLLKRFVDPRTKTDTSKEKEYQENVSEKTETELLNEEYKNLTRSIRNLTEEINLLTKNVQVMNQILLKKEGNYEQEAI